MKFETILKVILGTILAAYPFLVYFGLSYTSADFICILLGVFLILRLIIVSRAKAPVLGVGKSSQVFTTFMGLLICVGFYLTKDQIIVQLYPVVVSGMFCLIFSLSLIWGPPLIETIARIKEGHLEPKALAYTRRLTALWSIFFALNSGVSLATVLFFDMKIWTLYNGFISYLLVGSFIAGEWVYRKVYLEKNSSNRGIEKPLGQGLDKAEVELS